MKRLILLIIVGMLAYWVWARERSTLMQPAGPPSAHQNRPHYVQKREAKAQLAKAGREVQRALHDAEHEIRHAVDKTHDEVHRAIDEVRGVLLAKDDDDGDQVPAPEPRVVEREEAEGLPVAIVPGTRVTEAQAVPPAAPRPAIRTRVFGAPRPQPAPLVTDAETTLVLDGKISATPERSALQARDDLRHDISLWLGPEVPRTWPVPEVLLDSIVLDTQLETTVRDKLGPMYITHLTLDRSPESRARMIGVYNHEVVGRRLVNLGGSLAFVLMCLAAISSYIRADEATKGYYTNRLRMLAAAGVGAGGVLIYQMVT